MSVLRTDRQVAAMVGAGSPVVREKDDYYPTPVELTDALLAVEKFDGPIWEPACGDGAISRELEAAGHRVVSSDLVARGYGEARIDFLMEHTLPPGVRHCITNPPFKMAADFWDRACTLVPGKVVFMARLTWLEGSRRASLFQRHPLARIWVCPWRPKFQRGRQATKEDGGSMLAFAWYVRDPTHIGPPHLGWLSRPVTP